MPDHRGPGGSAAICNLPAGGPYLPRTAFGDAMDQINRAANGLLHLIVSLFDLILAAIGTIEAAIRTQLTALGVPAQVETAILIAVAVILVIAALRLFGGFFRLLILAFLVLLILHILLPVLQR